jgi:hypothetical protein
VDEISDGQLPLPLELLASPFRPRIQLVQPPLHLAERQSHILTVLLPLQEVRSLTLLAVNQGEKAHVHMPSDGIQLPLALLLHIL